MTEKSPFANFDHVGVVVRDIDGAVEYYQSLGIGPFKPSTIVGIDKKFRGKPADDAKLEIRSAQMGQVGLQLIQPVSGESVHMEFLERKGEGINHLCFVVDDLEKGTTELVKKGFEVIYSARFENDGGENYLDTGKFGGFCIQLLQRHPK